MERLEPYRSKRDPTRTPEPFGEDGTREVVPPNAARLFVVQQHAARALHWDLRLEVDGVLASWAVPKGPTLDPEIKRLAVRTEDHPLEYADFEGVIPPGSYGAGAMIVWDRGPYRSVDGRSPTAGLADGKLDLSLDGHVLRGRFALVRTKEEGGRHWLLLRKGSAPEPGAPITESHRCSVLSGLTVDELAAGADRREELAPALAGRPPWPPRSDALRPMLAATVEHPFTRDGWLFEPKLDGMRVLAVREDKAARLVSRSGRDVTSIFPEVALAVRHLPLDRLVLDGEVVAADARGRSSFPRLQRRLAGGPAPQRAWLETPVAYHVFDLLSAGGRDLRSLPLELRKEALSAVATRDGTVRFVDHVEREGEALFEAARAHGMEGVIGKRVDSRYLSGRRARTWLKMKVVRDARLAIVGWWTGRSSARPLGSLILAWREGDALVHAGSVGSGLTADESARLLKELAPLERRTPAFRGLPRDPSRVARFVRPERLCVVRYTECTPDGQLRHPVFIAEADEGEIDERPRSEDEVLREVSSDPPPPATEPALTRLDKVFWPEDGTTKGDLIRYYEAAWPFMGPYLRDRPIVLVRYPDGIEGKSFFQHDAPPFTPAWAERERIDGRDYFICNDLATLLHVVNSGAIPLHAWSSRRGHLDRPDWLVIDLDPKGAPFDDVVTLARRTRSLLEDLGAPALVKTSGREGLHVLIPLGGLLDHEQARSLATVIARVVASESPELATVIRPVAARGGRVYVDALQNGRGKTVVAPLSVRALPGAPVSMPLTWRQVTARLRPGSWTIRTALPRLRRHGDPLRPLLEGPAADVDRLLDALSERLDSGDEPPAG